MSYSLNAVIDKFSFSFNVQSKDLNKSKKTKQERNEALQKQWEKIS